MTVRRALAAVLLAAAVPAAAACHWHLTTRTPPKADAVAAPEFSLPDADGKAVALSGLLAKGPAIVVFYRGYW